MRDPTGNNPRTIYRDDTFIRSSGLRMQLTPDGDCREAAFEAKGAGLRVPPLSNVQFEYLHNGVWTPLWYGEVRVGGNARDVNGERYVLRTLARRLGEITLPPGFSTPQQPAHLTVRAILRAVMDSGQLGTFPVIEYDEGRCPDLGFDCRKIEDAEQETPAALLEQIAQDGMGLGVMVAWGVGADRFFFCRPARTDTAQLEAPTGNPLIPGSTIGLTWQPPVAETPYTAVLWYVAKRPDGKWVKHLSRSPEADRWGLRIKRERVGQGVEAWETVPGNYTLFAKPNGAGWQAISTLTAAEAGSLTDGVVLPSAAVMLEPKQPAAYLQFTPSAAAVRFVIAGEASSGGTLLGLKPPQNTFLLATGREIYASAWGETTLYATGDEPYAPAPFLSNFAGAAGEVTLRVAEMRAERINTALLDGLARYHYSTPAQEPADIETATFRPPRDLSGRVKVGDYNRAVEAWEYRLTAARGLTLAALTGQADDPAKLAQASLIKQRDGQATVNALTAQQ